jgi:hypothetical protein
MCSTDVNNKTTCELLCSNSKVAPLKQLTISRLELCAAALLSKLYQKTTQALHITIDESYLWTDYSITLTWIRGPPNKWKTFVANRVEAIQEQTTSATWRHVPSQFNPAELISRGVDPITLSSSNLWWKGPPWLSHEPSSWPPSEVNSSMHNCELKTVHVARLQSPRDFTQWFSK